MTRELIFGYGRVSTYKQTKGYSLEDQEEKIQAWVNYQERQGNFTNPVMRFYSEDETGSSIEKRVVFQQLMEDAERQKPSHVVVTKLDRWGRNTYDVVTNVSKLEELGIDFVCTELNIDTKTEMGKFMLTVFSGLAELELSFIRERTLVGIEKAKEKGVKFGRPRKSVNKEWVIEKLNEGVEVPYIAYKQGVSPRTIYNRMKEWGYEREWVNTNKLTKDVLKEELATKDIDDIVSEYKVDREYLVGKLEEYGLVS